jgi:WS/DGAT/MGAT family acyltransferase
MNYLSPVDGAFLKLETARTPMNFSALLTFKPPSNASASYLRELFTFMKSQAVITPPFNYKLAQNRLKSLAPAWVIDNDIDVDYHLRHSALPFPGGERELGILVARLHSNRIDMSRPLWECHLIEGLENNRFAILLKAHHSAADGMAAMRAVKAWLSEDPKVENAAGPWAVPAPESERVRDDGAPRRDIFRQALDFTGVQLKSIKELVGTLSRMSKRREYPEGGGLLTALSTPRTVFNARISPHRRLATQNYDLARIKALSEATGGTVNDVLLAVAAGGLRKYLEETDALPREPVVASVPIGLPRPDGKPGNAVAGFVVPIATDLDDPRERVRIINRITAKTKEQMLGMSQEALEKFTLIGLSPLILGQMTGLGSKMRPFFNLIVSNVVYSRNKSYFHGAELEAMYPVSVLFDGYALNLTIVGYGGKVCLGFTGCREAVPHLQRIAVYTGDALAEMEAAVLGKSAAPAKKKARKSAKRASASGS